MRSVWPQLEPLLPRISKPIQYVGGELGVVVKDWDTASVRWALMYPDAYEVGRPNQGVQILYEILNERPDVLAERTYAVWPDLERLMREHGVPQVTVDAHRPVGAFDLFGVLFATNVVYTNLVTAADPAQAAGAARGDRARAVRGGDLPGLHAGLPVLQGEDDHPSGAGAVDHHDRRHGARRARVLGLLRGRAAVAVQRRPLGDRRHLLRPRRPVRGRERVAVAAVHAGRRIQHHAGRGAVPGRPAHRADVRAGGRVRADPAGHQQDGDRRGPDPDGRHRV